MYWPKMYENHVPAYQMSSVPYLTASQISLGQVHEYTLPSVTRYFTIQNRGTLNTDELAFAFTSRGLDPAVGNFNKLSSGESYTIEARTVKLFVSCSAGSLVNYQVFFGLTDIPYSNFVLLTGSNGHQGVG